MSRDVLIYQFFVQYSQRNQLQHYEILKIIFTTHLGASLPYCTVTNMGYSKINSLVPYKLLKLFSSM